MTAIVKRPIDAWEQSIITIRPKLEKVLPQWLTVDRFVQQALVAMSKNQAIMDCDRNSVFHSLMALAELGLDPSGALGSGYLVPFKGVCTPVPGYRGLIDLAVRSGEVKGIKAVNVFWGDELDVMEGDRPRLHHKPLLPMSKEQERELENHRRPENLRGAYMVATLPGGNKQFLYMPFGDLEKVRLRAPGGKSERTPWFIDRLEMYLKCPIRKGVKQLPLSPVKASLLMRAEQIEEANEKLVDEKGADGEEDAQKPMKGADALKAALRKTKAEPEDAEYMSTDDYNAPPPDDVVLPKPDEPPKT